MAILLHDGLCWTTRLAICHVLFHDTTRLVGLPLRGVRVFKRFVWLGVGSVKAALSRPAHQRVTRTVGRLSLDNLNRGNSMNDQTNTASFTYESARVASLMEEYSRITNIGECREWKAKALAVASYMSETLAKTEQFIAVEKSRLEQASDKTEKTNAEIGLMQFENFKKIVGGQLERLNKTIDNLPMGEDDNELVNLPPENVTLRKRNLKTGSINLQVVRVIALAIIAFLLWYFFNGR
jgi:hypothetical protein